MITAWMYYMDFVTTWAMYHRSTFGTAIDRGHEKAAFLCIWLRLNRNKEPDRSEKSTKGY